MNKKKVAIIGTVGIPAKYGGFETLAEHLCSHMGETYQMYVYCTKKKYAKNERRKDFLGAKLIYLPFDANGISSIIYDCVSIIHALFYADVLMVLGVSGGVILPFVRRFTNKKIIVSIDGIEWKRDKWSRPAKCYLWWAEKTAVKYSHADIADNESIQDYTAYRYKTLSNIIEYGADHTLRVPSSPGYYEEYPFLKNNYAFKVCRIEPENNLHVVLEAFSNDLKIQLVIIGNWNNSEYGINLRKKYGKIPGIILLDPIYNQHKLDLIRGNACLYIHGHSAGGTNPSLVEAMYLGLPVIAFRVSYNITTTENNAIYFSSASELKKILSETTSDELKQNALRMKAVADRRYTWKIIADKYTYLVQRVLSTKEKIEVLPATGSMQISELMKMEMGHLAYHAYFYEKR